MNFTIRGTHPRLNASLSEVISRCPQTPYGVAVWAYDSIEGYVAPISSINLKQHDNVVRFNDQFLRTKINLEQSAVGAFLKSDGKSKVPR